jgi:hypothetical protein
MMNSFPARSNIPYTFNPVSNHESPPSLTPSKPVQDRLIVGVDFGTTYSGTEYGYRQERAMDS